MNKMDFERFIKNPMKILIYLICSLFSFKDLINHLLLLLFTQKV